MIGKECGLGKVNELKENLPYYLGSTLTTAALLNCDFQKIAENKASLIQAFFKHQFGARARINTPRA